MVAAADYCEGYKKFLDDAKTEREAVKAAIALAEEQGFVPYVRGMALKAGDKVYRSNRGKSLHAGGHRRGLSGRGRPDRRRPHRLSPPGPEALSPL